MTVTDTGSTSMGATAVDSAISFEKVGKQFDGEWVLEDMDIDVAPGTIIGLIGPSGSGKTTTVRLANGHYRADAGSVRTLGSDPVSLRASQRAQIGYLPQQPVLFDELSLWENLNFHASLNGVPFRRAARLNKMLELVELGDDRKKLVSESSGGMQRRLALAATMVHDPSILMLDEPTAGIDPILRRRFWEHFRALQARGTTLVITTQFVSEAAHCDVVGMLAQGRIAALGTPDELHRQAFGGVVVDVDVQAVLHHDHVSRIRALEGVSSAERTDDHRVRMSIQWDTLDPVEISRRLGDRLDSGADDDLVVAGVAEVAPDWDEVFIALVGADASADVNVTTADESAQEES